ncbi:MAG: pyridoxal phosphate-dependent aminotransferase [Planctomycetaceae bacterium]|nr:pyridoxal phosphate-dependent aminotransferase [Planctomycetaceae bacterium]
MKYNFDIITNRYGTDCIKYDFAEERGKSKDLLPMWVADMDFPAPPEVLEDIQNAVQHGIFGYTEPKEKYYNAVADWFGTRFGFRITKRDILKTPGVVFALTQAVRAFTEPDEAVLIQTPVYYPFYNVVRDNGRTLVCNPLVYHEGKYTIDFEDFEAKIAENSVKLFILCSPHNPVGRVWTLAELERMNEICVKHNVIIISDEVHCDFVWPGYTHTCFGVLNENAVIATAPSKTFNLAGLQTAHFFIKNAELRGKLRAELNRSGYSQLNTFGLAACQSAYTKGASWLAELNLYLAENIRYAKEFLTARLPKIKLVEPESTYLLWLDFSEYGLTQEDLDSRITEGAKLWLSSGTIFGADGKGFQRMNIACPKATLTDALGRLFGEFG